jgi:hypothetical protein
LREERRLRVLENRALRRILGPKRDKATGEWRKLHNEELNDLYSSPSIIRMIKSRMMWWAEQVALGGGSRGVHRVLVLKPKGKRPLGRPRLRWEDNIKMDFQDATCEGVDWRNLAQDRDRWRAPVHAAFNFRFP